MTATVSLIPLSLASSLSLKSTVNPRNSERTCRSSVAETANNSNSFEISSTCFCVRKRSVRG